MGLIYAISVLVFVCVIASVYSNEVTRPYLTTKVVVFTGIVGLIPYVNAILVIGSIVQRITNHKEYSTWSKEYRDSRIIESLQTIDSIVCRIIEMFKRDDVYEIIKQYKNTGVKVFKMVLCEDIYDMYFEQC